MGRSTERRQHGQKKKPNKAQQPRWWPTSHRPHVDGVDAVHIDRAASSYVDWLESVRGSGMMRGRPSQSARRGKLENLLRRVFVAGKMSEREPSLADPEAESNGVTIGTAVCGRPIFINPTTGDDANPGTEEKPVRTWAAVRAMLEKPTAGAER